MDQKTFNNGEIIFRQGDNSDCMYSVHSGKVGIFLDYGGPSETKLSELHSNQFLGEMGMLDSAPRSATAVALENGTVLEIITEADFQRFFEANPDRVMLMMMQMCSRLRRTTRDYIGACRTVHDAVEAEKTGAEKSRSLQARITKYTISGDSSYYETHC